MHIVTAIALFRQVLQNTAHFGPGSIGHLHLWRAFIAVRRHVSQIPADDLKAFFLVFSDPVHISGNFRMNLPAAEFFIGNGFPQCQFNHPGTGNAHGTSLDLDHEVRKTGHPCRHSVTFSQNCRYHGGLSHPAHRLQVGIKTAAAKGGQPGGSHDVRHAGAAGLAQINQRVAAMRGKHFDLAFLAPGDPARSCRHHGKIV